MSEGVGEGGGEGEANKGCVNEWVTAVDNGLNPTRESYVLVTRHVLQNRH